jgi:hypothetical protein
VVAYQLLTGRLPFVDKVNARPNAKEVFRSILEAGSYAVLPSVLSSDGVPPFSV